MRLQRTLFGVGVLALAVCAFAFPASARAEGTAYGPKVEPALADLAQAEEAAYADERRQRAASFDQDSTRLAVDSLERRRQHELAFRNSELQLAKKFAALRLNYEARLAAAQTKRARAYRAAVARLDAQYKRDLRKAYMRSAGAAVLHKQLKTRRVAALKGLKRTFEAAQVRHNAAFASEHAQRRTVYVAAKAKREARFHNQLDLLNARSAATLAERELAFGAERAARERMHAATLLPALAFGTDIAGARDQVGATLRHDLPLIDAQALTIRLGDIQRLADELGISRLAADLPTEPTDESDPPLSPPALPTEPTDMPDPPPSRPALESLFPGIVGARDAWAQGYTGSGIGIAVLDSGVSPLTDFGNRLTNASVSGLASASDDQLGHGTFVAAVAAGSSPDGRYSGVAPGAHIFAVNVSRVNTVYSSDVILGLQWVLANAATNNIRAVVLSLTESLPSSYRTSALDLAVEKIWQSGIVVVVSAGNSGPDTMQFAPANDPFAITVGASDPNATADTADDALASFSSYGKTIDGHLKPDVLAPGRHVVAALPVGSTLDLMAPEANHVSPGYVRMNGTSVAAPQVAGAVAILLQENPLLTPDQVKWLLVSTARPVTGSNANGIDVARALSYDGELGHANAGLSKSLGPVGRGDDDRKSEFNSGALKEALAWEKVARTLETLNRWDKAAQAWDKAAELWLEELDVAYKSAVDSDLGANAWVKSGDWSKAAESWERAGTAAGRVFAWQSAATYLGLAAGAWEKEKKGDFAKAALAWERASRAAELAAAMLTANFENKAIAWIKAVSALENAAADWTKKGARDKAAAAEARRVALRAQAVAWANTSWTNTSWTNTSWTNTSWTNTSWLNTSWTNTSWTNTSWTNTSWTNTSWTSASWE